MRDETSPKGHFRLLGVHESSRGKGLELTPEIRSDFHLQPSDCAGLRNAIEAKTRRGVRVDFKLHPKCPSRSLRANLAVSGCSQEVVETCGGAAL